jgi:hypothetical protein
MATLPSMRNMSVTVMAVNIGVPREPEVGGSMEGMNTQSLLLLQPR